MKPSCQGEADRKMKQITQWLLFQIRELRSLMRNAQTQFSALCWQILIYDHMSRNGA